MKAYLAGPYRARTQLQRCADELKAIGYGITARWLTGDHEGAPDAAADEPLADRQRWAREDLDDIKAADVLVGFTSAAAWALGSSAPAPWNFGASGGRHIETGYAIALNKPVVLIGEPENVFHWLPIVRAFECWHDAFVHLSSRLVTAERGYPVQAS